MNTPLHLTAEGRALLREGAHAFDLDLGDAETQFDRLYGLLVAANDTMNLTALRTERDIVLKHFVDSLSCLRGGWFDGPQHVVDLGTGAGFPGLPLALLKSELSFTLVDATRRKVEFVSRTAAALGLTNVGTLTARAETLGRDPAWRGTSDRVVSRAVSATNVLIELSLPLLRLGGLLIAQKGPDAHAELEAARGALDLVGGEVRAIEAFELPFQGGARHLVVIEKTRETPERFPRREGVPTKQPLT